MNMDIIHVLYLIYILRDMFLLKGLIVKYAVYMLSNYILNIRMTVLINKLLSHIRRSS